MINADKYDGCEMMRVNYIGAGLMGDNVVLKICVHQR